jgi:hypothetical protein
VTKGHGRIETRPIRTSTDLVGYIDFPHAAQVFFLHRYTTDLKAKELRSEFTCGITNLSPEEAKPSLLLNYSRHHWSIENKVHWFHDVTFDEDRSRIRKHAGPHVMTSLRNPAINLLRMAGTNNISQGLRRCSWSTNRTLRLIGVVID